MATSEAQSKSLIFQAQYLVADQLNKCSDLSATPFWPEDLLDIEYQIHDALSKQGIACTVMTPQLNYQGKCGKSTAWDFSNLQLVIVENPQINRARTDAMTALDVGYVAQEWLAGPLSETKGMFAPVSIKQGEDGGLVVVTVEMKALLHDTRDVTSFPSRQGFKFSDGIFLPITDSFMGQNAQMIDLVLNTTFGYRSSDIVELVAYSNVNYASGGVTVLTSLERAYIDSSCGSINSNIFSAQSLKEVVFKGRTLAQVKAMDNYPWGIEDTSIIQAEL